jgi:hypothetical protein
VPTSNVDNRSDGREVEIGCLESLTVGASRVRGYARLDATHGCARKLMRCRLVCGHDSSGPRSRMFIALLRLNTIHPGSFSSPGGGEPIIRYFTLRRCTQCLSCQALAHVRLNDAKVPVLPSLPGPCGVSHAKRVEASGHFPLNVGADAAARRYCRPRH